MNGYLWIEAAVLCVVFFLIIFFFVFFDRRGGLQWYPKEVQKAALQRGVITEERLKIQNKTSKTLMLIAGAVMILGSVFYVNKTQEWIKAFGQIYFLCFVMNWFDAIVIDYIWVRKTKYWIIPELSDLEISKSLGFLIRERLVMCLVYIPLSALFACIVWI